MTFTFPNPADTTEFTGENGITYRWDADDSKWQVKTTAALEKYATTAYSDAEDKKLQNQIDRLKEQVDILNEINKGSVAIYTVKNTFGTPVSRPGEFSTNTGFYASVNTMSFGTADADGNPTKEMANGNIIETFDLEENQVNRYSITDASGAPTVVSVKYISGKLTYVIGNEIEVNIY